MQKKKLLCACLASILCVALGLGFSSCKGNVYNLEFISEGATVASVKTAGEEVIKIPPDPARDGFAFDGWFQDADTTLRPFAQTSLSDKKLTHDIRVYAHWSKLRTLTFVADGVTVATFSCREGTDDILFPAVPAKSGCVGFWEDCPAVGDGTVHALYYSTEMSEGLTFEYVSASKSYRVSGYDGTASEAVIPAYYKDCPVTAVKSSAFADCTPRAVFIPATVTSFGTDAFKGCVGLKTVTFDGNVGQWCEIEFGNRYSNPLCQADALYFGDTLVRDVTVPDGVTSVAAHAFADYALLKSVTIADSVTSIGSRAFENCTALSRADIGRDVTTIGFDAFGGCGNLTEITLPQGLDKILDGAFAGCESLKNVLFDGDLTDWCNIDFGDDAPMLCASELYIDGTRISDNLTLPVGIRKISKAAFANCGQLTSVTIPSSVNKIDEYAFYGCRALENVTLPDGLSEIGGRAFACCDALRVVTLPQSLSLLGESAFENCKALRGVIIPDGVSFIAQNAFLNCENLSSVKLGNGIKELRDGAFQGCGTLQRVEIPREAQRLGDGVFKDCASLAEVVLSDAVTHVGEKIFGGCTALSSVSIGAGLTSIKHLFDDCKTLETITISSANPALTSFGGGIYTKDTSRLLFVPQGLQGALEIPDGVTSIAERACNDCTALIDVFVSPDVTDVGRHAFNGCKSLVRITLPFAGENAYVEGRRLSHIFNDSAPYVPLSLKRVVITEEDTVSEKAFFDCNNIEEIVYTRPIKGIGAYAFYNCETLASFDLGNAEFLDEYAFWNCRSLKQIILPNSLVSMPEIAIGPCPSMTDIWCEASEIPEGWVEDWNMYCLSASVHLGGTWDYVDGTPTPK